jgi:hypothetical protein
MYFKLYTVYCSTRVLDYFIINKISCLAPPSLYILS